MYLELAVCLWLLEILCLYYVLFFVLRLEYIYKKTHEKEREREEDVLYYVLRNLLITLLYCVN